MKRKWIQLVGEDGTAFTSETAVSVEIEDVADLQDAVFAKVSRALPANVVAPDLTVFKDQAAYEAKQALGSRDSLATINEKATLIVQVPKQEPTAVQASERQSRDGEALLLVRQSIALQTKLAAKLEHLNATLAPEPSDSYSNAGLGEHELERLKKDDMFIEVQPTEDGDAFWSAQDQLQANSIEREDAFDAIIIPFLSAILRSCDLVFVNSERYEWLPESPFVSRTMNSDLKPDGFATHRGMYRAKPAPND